MCTILVAKTKALISFAVTAKLICAFVFAYADCWFSNEVTQLLFVTYLVLFYNCNLFLLERKFYTLCCVVPGYKNIFMLMSITF